MVTAYVTYSPLLSVADAARELGVSPRRIRALLAQGRIAGAVKLGREWVIPAPVRKLPPARSRKLGL